MCGRYVLTTDIEAIQLEFDLKTLPEQHQPRYNIAPSQPIAVITNAQPDTLTFHQWGLIPSWAKDPKIGYKMINARSETAHEKPSFRAAFKRRRCLIPASGFFEWQKQADGKQPMYIHLKAREVFAFAGLWETWYDADGGELRTATILTTEANDFMKDIHNRMPVILNKADYARWLDPGEPEMVELMALMQQYDPGQMTAYPVSTLVNRPGNDTPEVLNQLQ